MVSLIHKHCEIDYLTLIKLAHKHDTTSLLCFLWDRKIFGLNSLITYLIDRKEWSQLATLLTNKAVSGDKIVSLLRQEGHNDVVADFYQRQILEVKDLI